MARSPGTERRRPLRIIGALVLAVAMFLAGPMLAVASASARPLSLGEWMRTIYATPDRKVDPTEKGVAPTTPTAPLPQLQTSSEPSAPSEPQIAPEVPHFWIRPGARRKRA